MLSLYRRMLSIRHAETDLRGTALRWLRTPTEVLAFGRGERFLCITNLSLAPISLPADATLLLASAPLPDGWLPVDATAWLRVSARPASSEGGRG
jgi:alpha-glucosidase